MLSLRNVPRVASFETPGNSVCGCIKGVCLVFVRDGCAPSSWPDTLSGSWPGLSAGDSCFSLFLGGKLPPLSGTCSLPTHCQASRLPIFDPVSARRLQVPPMAFEPDSWLVSMSLPFLCSHLLSCGAGAGRKLCSGRHGEQGHWLQVPVPDTMLLMAGLFLPSTPPCHCPTLLPSPLPSF